MFYRLINQNVFILLFAFFLLTILITAFFLSSNLNFDERGFASFDWKCGQKVAIGHNQYETILIGDTCWLDENLKTETSNSLCYNNNQENCVKYGALYNWDDAMAVCSDGWRLPSYDLHFEEILDSGDWRKLNLSQKGGIFSGDFEMLEDTIYFWTATPHTDLDRALMVSFGDNIEDPSLVTNEYGFSVRCVKDLEFEDKIPLELSLNFEGYYLNTGLSRYISLDYQNLRETNIKNANLEFNFDGFDINSVETDYCDVSRFDLLNDNMLVLNLRDCNYPDKNDAFVKIFVDSLNISSFELDVLQDRSRIIVSENKEIFVSMQLSDLECSRLSNENDPNFDCKQGFVCNYDSKCYPGDLSGDGRIAYSDYQFFLQDWEYFSEEGVYNSRSDFNEDSKVNILDYDIFRTSWLATEELRDTEWW